MSCSGQRRIVHSEYASHLSMISVLKEWKFFLSKALHSHFSTTVRKLFGVGMTEPIPGEEALRATRVSVLLTQREAPGCVGSQGTVRCSGARGQRARPP